MLCMIIALVSAGLWLCIMLAAGYICVAFPNEGDNYGVVGGFTAVVLLIILAIGAAFFSFNLGGGLMR